MIFVVFWTEAPVAVSKSHKVAGDVAGTLGYIPGTVLRGALAAAYMYKKGADERSDEFRRLFLSDEVRFGNLYPEGSRPIPLTAWSCKLEPGFTKDGGHGVVDCLPHPLEEGRPTYCKQPHTPGVLLERYTGFYKNNGEYRSFGVDTRVIARTAIDETYGIASHGSLYALEAIEEGHYFRGYVKIDKDDWEMLKDLLPLIGDDRGTKRLAYLGTARTRGLGEAVLADDYEPANGSTLSLYGRDTDTLAQRLKAFNQWVEGKFTSDGGRLFFTIGLDSDAVIVDEHLRHRESLDEKDLLRELSYMGFDGDIPEGVKLEGMAASTRIVSGWNVKLGLPKHDDLAINKGSVFLFSAPRECKEALLGALVFLEAEGIGERRNEGFGGLVVCDPFHREVSWS